MTDSEVPQSTKDHDDKFQLKHVRQKNENRANASPDPLRKQGIVMETSNRMQ